MARPAHIAALDAALEQHLAELAEAEQRQVEVHAEHQEFLRLHAAELAAVESANKARMTAYYAADSCEKAIRKLGFVVLDGRKTVAPDVSRLDGHPGDFCRPVTTTTDTSPSDGAREDGTR